jgi:hypothetical protein
MIRLSLPRILAGAALATTTLHAAATDAASTPEHLATMAVDLIPSDMPPPAVALADTAVDFDALRVAWGRRVDYHQRCEQSLPAKAWNEAWQAKDAAKAYGIASTWLANCPVVESAQMWAYVSAKSLGDEARTAMHLRWLRGLIGSVLKTGDGRTPETAWKTISGAEEYAVLNALGMRAEQQALVMKPVPLDRMTVRPAAGGDQSVLYFNPELHFVRLAHEMGQK